MNLAIILVLVAIGFVLGLIIGYLSAKSMCREEPIGDLRIDESDPEDVPLLFLELNSESHLNALKLRKKVTLNVKAENYISQK